MPARLGDDVPAGKPGEPMSIIVAKSHIVAGKVRLDVQAPATLQVRRGQKLLIKHVYRAEEDSKEKEEYRFLLRSNLNGKDHAPSIARIGDIYAVAEDVAGYLVHEHVTSGSGRQELTFEVGAEYVVGGWKDPTVTAFDQQQAKGKISIVVH